MKNVMNHFSGLVGSVHVLRRIFNAPVSGDRLTRPYRTGLTSRVVAYSNDEIQLELIGCRKFNLTLAARILGWYLLFFEKLENQRIDFSNRKTAGTKAAELVLGDVVEDAFGDDAAGRVTGTQEQHIKYVIRNDS